MSDSCGQETIQLQVQADTEEGYEALVTKAMARVKEFLPDAAIYRNETEANRAEVTVEAWFIACAHSEISHGGQALGGTFTFERRG